MSERNFETIVEGAFYRKASGRYTGPAKRKVGGNPSYPWEIDGLAYTDDGYAYKDKRDDPYNLVARVNPDGTPWVEQSEPATEPEKRLPQPGEKWLTRGGFVATVKKRHEVDARGRTLTGVVMLEFGEAVCLWASDGHVSGTGIDPCDLVEYVGPIAQIPVANPEDEPAKYEKSKGKDFKLAIGGVYSLFDLDPHVLGFDFDSGGSQLSVKLIDGRDAWFTKATERLWECVGIGECDQATPSVKQVVQDLDADLFNKALTGERGEDQQRIAIEVAKLGAMLLRKNSDYGSSAWKRPVLAPHLKPATSILVRMSDKIERILQLATKPPEVAEEKIEQTIDDFVGYWILAKAAPNRAS